MASELTFQQRLFNNADGNLFVGSTISAGTLIMSYTFLSSV
jgi:hypothetical protein